MAQLKGGYCMRHSCVIEPVFATRFCGGYGWHSSRMVIGCSIPASMCKFFRMFLWGLRVAQLRGGYCMWRSCVIEPVFVPRFLGVKVKVKATGSLYVL